MVKVVPAMFVWCAMTACFFGTSNFLAGYLNVVLKAVPWMSIAVWWLSVSILGLPYCYITLGRTTGWTKIVLDQNGQTYPDDEKKNYYMGILFSLFSAFSAGFAMVCLKFSFTTDSINIGPLNAVISSDVLLAAIFCHIILKERLSKLQWCTVILLVIGVTVMLATGNEPIDEFVVGEGQEAPTSDGVKGAPEGLQAPVVDSKFLIALIWACGAATGFAASNMCTKYAFRHKAHPNTVNFMRMCGMLTMGIIGLIYSLTFETPLSRNFEGEWKLRWTLNVFQGFVKMFGLLCITQALTYEATGIAICMIGGGVNIMVFLLSTMIMSTPPTEKTIGMFLVLVSICAMPLLSPTAKDEPEDDESVGEKKGDQLDDTVSTNSSDNDTVRKKRNPESPCGNGLPVDLC